MQSSDKAEISHVACHQSKTVKTNLAKLVPKHKVPIKARDRRFLEETGTLKQIYGMCSRYIDGMYYVYVDLSNNPGSTHAYRQCIYIFLNNLKYKC